MILLTGAPAASPTHIVVAVGHAIVIILQSQHQQDAIVPLPGANAQFLKTRLRIVRNVGTASGIQHLHHDLRTSLGKERCVHSVDMFHGAVRQDTGMVIGIRIGTHHSRGRLAGIQRLPGLTQQNAGQNSRHHDDRRHRAFLKNFHRQSSF